MGHCRYDKLLSSVRSSGRGAPPPGMCVVGVSVMGEEVMRGVIGEYQRGQVSECVCVCVCACACTCLCVHRCVCACARGYMFSSVQSFMCGM